MKKYELVREIFNSCDNSKMRDVSITEIITDDVRGIVMGYMDRESTCEETLRPDGVWVFELSSEGLSQMLTFTEIV